MLSNKFSLMLCIYLLQKFDIIKCNFIDQGAGMPFLGHTNATNLAYGGKIRVDVDINGESTRVVHLKLRRLFL